MPESATDPSASSCNRLYPRPRFEESQLLGPDPFLPRPRDARAFRQRKLGQSARPAARGPAPRTIGNAGGPMKPSGSDPARLVLRTIQMVQLTPSPRFPGEGRDPLLPWAWAFAGEARLNEVLNGPVHRVNESEH